MPPLRILYVASYYKPAFHYGGPVRSVATICEGLAQAGATVTVLTTNAGCERSNEIPIGQPVWVDRVRVSYHQLARGTPERLFYSPSLAESCRREVGEHDVVVLETLFTLPTGPVVAACRRGGIPYVVPPRGQLLPWALRQKALKKRIYLALVGRRYLDAAAALVCSDESERDAVAALRFKAPAVVVPNPVDTKSLRQLPPRGSMKRNLGIPPTHPVVLMLGRLHGVKNPDVALEMLGLVGRQDVHLVFAGPDEERYQPRLEHRAQALGCADRIHFTGLLVDEPRLEAFADSDLLVMPSRMESFGMAAVEAMAAGLPVLLSRDVPVGRWVEEAGAGRVVAASPQCLAAACEELLSQLSVLRAMGTNAQRLAQDRFDTDAVSRQMLALCESIAATGRPQPTEPRQ